MRNYITTLLIILGGGAACGCQATDPLVKGWHPATEHEMRQVIGETVIQALHQYQDWMLRQTHKKPRDRMPTGKPKLPLT